MVIGIFCDGADLKTMAGLIDQCDGVTTNPSLLKKSGITDYRAFARAVVDIAGGLPVSFEVLADDLQTMERQAREIASWGGHIWVKVPITNTKGESCAPLISKLAAGGVTVNVTAVLSKGQVRTAVEALGERGVISVFAGRIADTGRDPVRIMNSASTRIKDKDILLLWASARQVYDVVKAEEAGCDIITLSPELIAKLPLLGSSLEEYSLETVRQFARDAEGITL